jgi:hypothetical protein
MGEWLILANIPISHSLSAYPNRPLGWSSYVGDNSTGWVKNMVIYLNHSSSIPLQRIFMHIFSS